MNVGICFDLRNPPGWATDLSRLYGFSLELCEEAERRGCHSIWLTEHHLLFDDGYLPPKRVQDRVPIWMGYQGPNGAARAGRLGEGLLSADAKLWPAYRDVAVRTPDGWRLASRTAVLRRSEEW